MIATTVRGPVIAALARCHASDIDRAGWALATGGTPPHPRLHRHLRPPPRAQAPHLAAGSASTRGRGGAPRAPVTPTTSSSRRKMRRGAIREFLWRVVEAVIQAGATTINLPDTVGYSTPDEIDGVLPGDHRPRAELRPGDLEHALP